MSDSEPRLSGADRALIGMLHEELTGTAEVDARQFDEGLHRKLRRSVARRRAAGIGALVLVLGASIAVLVLSREEPTEWSYTPEAESASSEAPPQYASADVSDVAEVASGWASAELGDLHEVLAFEAGGSDWLLREDVLPEEYQAFVGLGALSTQ